MTQHGEWALTHTGEAIVISSGLIFLGGKKPKGLTLDVVLGMIKEHPNVGYYTKCLPRMVTLGEAIQAGKLEDVGTMKPMFSTIDLYKIKRERIYKSVPLTGRDLLTKVYKSKPERME